VEIAASGREEDAMPVNSGRATPQAINGPQTLALATLLAGFGAFGLLVLFLPPPLILPAISTLLLAAAGGIALIAWRRPRPHQSMLSYWDLAGAMTFIGIAAALMSEPDQALPLLEASHTTRPE
jgi:hypothetical protein